MMKKQKLLLFSSILALSLILGGCGPKAADTAKEDTSPEEALQSEDIFYVKSELVSIQSFNHQLVLPGKAEPIETVMVAAKTAGDVESANYDIGDKVEKDAVLLTIDDENYQIALSSAKLGLEQASINLKTAKDDYERNKLLFESGAISKTTLEALENGYKQASIGYKTAKNSHDSAKINLNNTRIEAPISGIISSKNFAIGENLNPGTSVYTIVNTDEMNVIIGVPEQYIAGITPGLEVSLSTPYSMETWMGKVVNVSPVKDEKSLNYTIKILVDNIDSTMKAGMSLDATITTGNDSTNLAFNKLGLVLEEEDTYVYVNNNGKAKMVEVKIGRSNDDYYEILDGLEEGDEVITEGSGMLETGDIIEINN